MAERESSTRRAALAPCGSGRPHLRGPWLTGHSDGDQLVLGGSADRARQPVAGRRPVADGMAPTGFPPHTPIRRRPTATVLGRVNRTAAASTPGGPRSGRAHCRARRPHDVGFGRPRFRTDNTTSVVRRVPDPTLAHPAQYGNACVPHRLSKVMTRCEAGCLQHATQRQPSTSIKDQR
jgi:hypothetical protein